MVVHQVAARLKSDAVAAGNDGAVSIDGQILRTWPDLIDFICDKVTDDNDRPRWAGPVTGIGTVNAFIRRLRSSQKHLAPIIRGDLTDSPAAESPPRTSRSPSWTCTPCTTGRNGSSSASCSPPRPNARKPPAPAGCCSRCSTSSTSTHLATGPRRSRRSCSTSPNAAARSASSSSAPSRPPSEVERRIVSNSSIKIVGRLDPAEAGRPEYGFLPASQRGRATLAKPGTMFISQPEIPVPLAVEFPFPAWATRLTEVTDPTFASLHRHGTADGSPDGAAPRRDTNPFDAAARPRRRRRRRRTRTAAVLTTASPYPRPSPATSRRSRP